MSRRLILALAFAFLFGLGQLGVLTHAISHTDDWQQVPPPKHDKPESLSACMQCIAHANLGHAMASAALVVVAIPYVPPTDGTLLVIDGTLYPPQYRARAPPTPLA